MTRGPAQPDLMAWAKTAPNVGQNLMGNVVTYATSSTSPPATYTQASSIA